MNIMGKKVMQKLETYIFEDGTAITQVVYNGNNNEEVLEIVVKETYCKFGSIQIPAKSDIGKLIPISHTINIMVTDGKKTKEYNKKTHASVRGRINGLTDIMNDFKIKPGTTIALKYNLKKNILYIKINR